MKDTDVLSQEQLCALFGFAPISEPNPDVFTSKFKEKDMADELLSTEQIEKLLSVMGSMYKPEMTPQTLQDLNVANIDLSKAEPEKEQVQPPSEKLDTCKKKLKVLQTEHTQAARTIGARLSKMLVTCLEIKVTCIDELLYSEYLFGIDNPTHYNVIEVTYPCINRQQVKKGCMYLDMNTSIVFPMIDRMLGGGREPTIRCRRPLTNIEKALVARITDVFLQEIKQTGICGSKLDIIRTESNPQLITTTPHGAAVVVVCYEVCLPDVRCSITLCVPSAMLNELIPDD